MFDIENNELIMRLIDMREDNEIIIPLYVQVYGKRYSILEMDEITVRFTEGAFKVGFGTADALFMKNSFPTNRASEFDVINVFTSYDDNMDRNIRYMVFETGDVDTEANDTLRDQVHEYYQMLFKHVWNNVDKHIKKLLSTDFDY